MKLEVIEIIEETPDVKTFRLERPFGFDFLPGQYCLLSFADKPDFEGIEKPFTISSSPEETDFLDFTVKKMGRFTSELFRLNPGENLEVNGPKDTNLEFSGSPEDIVFVAGGSGITPFMSIIRYIRDKKMKNRITLLYGNTTMKDIIFRKELEGYGNIKLINVLTEEDWEGEKGYITEEKIKRFVDAPEKKVFYLCGPPPMMESLKPVIENLGALEVKVEGWKIPGKSDFEVKKMKMESNQMYKCEICGNIVELAQVGGGELVCCGEPMKLLEAKTKEQEGKEKHVPIIEVDGNDVIVKVGSVEHPMLDNHYIELIEILKDGKVISSRWLKPNEKPEARFCLEIPPDGITARGLCNLHGLWRS